MIERNSNDIHRSSLVEQVFIALKQFINSDEVEIGQKMPSETLLCEQYRVSRTTIREALRMLQAKGYVELFPNRGAFVAAKSGQNTAEASTWMSVHAHEVMDILEVRSVIEPLSASLAARRATDTERYAIRGVASLFENASKSGDQENMAAQDEKFHEAIAKASHNSFIVEIDGIIAEGLRGFRMRTFAIDQHGELAVGPHDAITDAILNGDERKAEELMRDHMESNISITNRYIK